LNITSFEKAAKELKLHVYLSSVEHLTLNIKLLDNGLVTLCFFGGVENKG